MTARRSFLWAAAGQVLIFIVGFAGSVIVTRILTPIEVGTYVLGAALVGLCTAATAFNMGAYIVGEAELSSSTMDCAFTLNAFLAVILSTIVLIVSRFSAEVVGSVDAGQVMLVLAVQPLLGALTFRSMTMLHRNMQFRAVALINILATTAGTAVTVLSALSGEGFMSQAWGALTVAAVSAGGFVTVGARYVSFRVGLTNWREIAVFGGRMLTISGAAMVTARLSEVIIGRMLGLQALGIFSRASGLSNQLWDNVYGTATRVAFAQLSKDYRENGDLRESFLHAIRLIAGLMCPLLAGMAVLAPYIIGLLYGDKWLGAALPFSILLVAQIVAIGFGMNWELFVIRRETGRQTRIELIRNLVALSAVTIGSLFSVAAATLGRLFDNSVGLLLYRAHVLRLSGASGSEFRSIFSETLLLTVVGAGPAGVLMLTQRSHSLSHVAVVVAILTGVSGWYAALFVLNHPLGRELKFFASKLTRLNSARSGVSDV